MKKFAKEVKILVAITLIPFIVLAYFLFYESARMRIEDEKRKNTELAKATAQYLDAYIKSVKYSLSGWHDSHRETLTPQLADEILDNLRYREDAESYFVLDRQGKVLAAYTALGQAYTPQLNVDTLNRIDQHGTAVELINLQGDPVRAVVATSIKGKNEEVLGFTGAVVSMQKIAKEFANIKVSNNGYMIMIDDRGYVLVHPQAALLRKRIPLSQMKQDPIYREALKAKPGALEIVAPFDGQRKLFAFAPVKETGWIVLLVEPETDLQVLMTEKLTRNSAIFLLVGFSVSLLFLYLRSIRRREAERVAIKQEKMALVGQLAAGMAHEIRNPLTAIKGFLQMMQGDVLLSDKNKRKIDIMMEETMQIETILNETLLLAKPQKQKLQDFDLVSQIKQALPVVEAEAALKSVQLQYNLSSRPLIVKGDINHFKQAFVNIVKNALEASTKEGCVTIAANAQYHYAYLVVADDGVGIDSADLDKIGTPFFTTKDTGTGLGLMVTRRIIESMSGQLEFISTKGKGTKVVVKIPLVQLN